MLLEGTV